MESKPQTRRRWFQFRLRTLFIVTAVVALACPWTAAEYRAYQQRAETDWALQEVMEAMLSPNPNARQVDLLRFFVTD